MTAHLFLDLLIAVVAMAAVALLGLAMQADSDPAALFANCSRRPGYL
jgi:hypothetical protein